VDTPEHSVAQLVQQRGTQFDRMYIGRMLREHREHVQKLEQIAQEHPDREVQQFARELLPTMQQHLQQAQRIQTQLAGEPVRDPAGAEPDEREREELDRPDRPQIEPRQPQTEPDNR
jgi:uncharacterized protein (DUF305 family)